MNHNASWLQRNVIGFGLTSFFNDFSHEMTTALLPTLVAQLVGAMHVPLALGLISGISNAAASLIKVWSGIITDRVTYYKNLLLIGYGVTPLFVGLIGTATAVWQVLIYKTLAWLGRGFREPMRDAWIAQTVAPSWYGHAFGFVRAFDTLGAIAGPVVVFYALPWYEVRTIFYISFIPGVLSVLALLLVTREDTTAVSLRSAATSWQMQFSALPRNFISFVVIMFVFGCGNFNKTLIIYRAQELFAGEASSSIVATGWAILLYAMFNVIRAMSEYVLGVLGDAVSKRYLLALFGFGLFGVASLLMIFSSASVGMWVLIFVAAGVSTGAVTSLEKSYAAELLPDGVRGTGFGVLQMIDGVGDLVSSLMVGIIWSSFAPVYGFAYAAVLSFVGMCLLFFSRID